MKKKKRKKKREKKRKSVKKELINKEKTKNIDQKGPLIYA